MSDENLERQQGRLARHAGATRALAGLGLSAGTIARFALGLKAPYRSRVDGAIIENALSYPVFGADGARLPRFAFLNLDGVTLAPPHPVGWGVGTPLSYWSGIASPTRPLIVVGDVATLWLLDQLLDRQDAMSPVILTRSHGSDLPPEWTSERFWSDWQSVSILDDERRGPSIGEAICRIADREIRRVALPVGHGGWDGALRSGMSVADFAERLATATVWTMPPEKAPADDDDLGDLGYAPVRIGNAFIGGNIYYPYLVEERTFQQSRRLGERRSAVQGYATRVLRSDGLVLRVETLPAPPGAPDDSRVVALSDGTRIDAEPAVSRFSSWSFDSIQRFVRVRKEGRHELHRPLDLIAADLERYLRDCVWLPAEGDYSVATAFILVTYVYQVFDAVPLLLVTGEKASGKSEFAQAVADLACNGVVVGQASAASLVRLMHEVRGLLVIDDLERVGASAGAFGEISQMLKLGYKRASGRKPVVDRSGNVVTLDFYGPKLLTNTRGVEPILGSRMLTITTAPMPDAVAAGAELPGPDALQAQDLRNELHCWGMARAADVHGQYEAATRRKGRREEIEAPLRALAALVGEGFLRRLDDALRRTNGCTALDDPVDRVRRAVATIGPAGRITIQQLQLELALSRNAESDTSPETIGRALIAADLRRSDGPATRVRLHGTLCRVVTLDGAAAAGGSKGEASDPLDFCLRNSCSGCRYVSVCPATLPALHAGKARARRAA